MRVDPADRLTNLGRKLRDLLMSRRLALDPEATGVVELGDFGKRCERLADLAGQSVVELAAATTGEARCARIVCEQIELAARLAALLETLPRGPRRQEGQLAVLEEAALDLEAARKAELQFEEEPSLTDLATLARSERERFAPLLAFGGRIVPGATGRIVRGEVLRALRRALLERALANDPAPFELSVDRAGSLRFGEFEFHAEAAGEGFARMPHEPPEVRKALDLREATPDPELRDFLLVKAVDEALFALLAPKLGSGAWLSKVRALSRRPGKRFSVRPEAVQRPVEGWDTRDAAVAAEKLAARRLGPDWARLPRGAYPYRLFLGEDDRLAADLLALGPVLRRMEKGVAPDDPETVRKRAEGTLRALLGLLG